MRAICLVILIILAGVLVSIYNEIPVNNNVIIKTSNKVAPSENIKPISATSLMPVHGSGEYIFNFKQLCGLAFIFALLGGVVTYLSSWKYLKILYSKSFEAYSTELQKQYNKAIRQKNFTDRYFGSERSGKKI